MSVGILAYGSLIEDPGAEIRPRIVRRIATQTPFPVEYGRLSRKRGCGPTVVPHVAGSQVSAVILVLSESVSVEEGQDLLWRRETDNIGSNRRYERKDSSNAVLVEDHGELCGV